jgi:hypothetical protein
MDLLTEKACKKNYPLYSVSIFLKKLPYVIPSVIILKYIFKKSILQNYKIIILI